MGRSDRRRAARLMIAAAWFGAAGVVAQDFAGSQFRYGARVDVGAFAYRRDIPAGNPGLVEIRLDAAVLAHTRVEFADLRIVASDGRQVPYLVERLAEQISIRLPPLEKEAPRFDPMRGLRTGERQDVPRKGLSGYAGRLPYAHLGPARLEVTTPARVFEREVYAEFGEDIDTRPGVPSMILQRKCWSHADPDRDAPPLTIDVPSLRDDTFHLVVGDGDNAPLPLGRPTLLLPAYRVRFVRPDRSPLRLIYGNREIDPPRYDLALVARRLRDEPAAQVTAGPEQRTAAPRVPAGVVFWSALALAVAALIALLVRLLRGSAAA